MLPDAAATQLFAFVSALAVAYFTGAWRKFGRRMERLYELAAKLPPGEVRERFELAGQREAERMAKEKLDKPPRHVRLAWPILMLALFFFADGALGNPIAHRLNRFLTFNATVLRSLATEAYRDEPDLSYRFWYALTAFGLAFAYAVLWSAVVLWIYYTDKWQWWKKAHALQIRRARLRSDRKRTDHGRLGTPS